MNYYHCINVDCRHYCTMREIIGQINAQQMCAFFNNSNMMLRGIVNVIHRYFLSYNIHYVLASRCASCFAKYLIQNKHDSVRYEFNEDVINIGDSIALTVNKISIHAERACLKMYGEPIPLLIMQFITGIYLLIKLPDLKFFV